MGGWETAGSLKQKPGKKWASRMGCLTRLADWFYSLFDAIRGAIAAPK
jgi:hypothetical protein